MPDQSQADQRQTEGGMTSPSHQEGNRMRQFVVSLAALMAAVAAQPAAAQAPKLDDLPAALKPAGMSVYLEVPATGVQIYTCSHHDAGPTWEAASGGKVVAAVKANAPSPTAGAIPWLLLDIKSSEGSGTFNQAKSILRVSTAGGVAPTSGCDQANVGKESRVPYTATYLFL